MSSEPGKVFAQSGVYFKFKATKKNEAQSTEHRTQNTEHRTHSTEHRPQNTEHRTQSWLIAS